MLTVTFKNVGHGDTIILEWRNGRGENEIGIIDCHLRDGKSNLAVEHIKVHGYKKVRFMILTHPHTDHFSGFPSLLEFCWNQGIKIERFWHTVAFNNAFMEELADNKITAGKISLNHFLDSFVSFKKDKNILKKLFRKINDLQEKAIIEETGIVNNTSMVKLNEKLWIEFLSPANEELSRYCRETFNKNPENQLMISKRQNNPWTNLLSSFIKICTKDWYVLLPSGSMRSTIERIMNQYGDRLNSGLRIAQIPNHGSLHSHFEPFWKRIPGKEGVTVFVPVGLKLDCPSKEVIQFFEKNFKEVHPTNYVRGLKECFDDKSKTSVERVRYIDTLFDWSADGFIKTRESLSERDNLFICREKQVRIEEDGAYTIITDPVKI